MDRMHLPSSLRFFVLVPLILVLAGWNTAGGEEITWTNLDDGELFSGPDKQTLVTFTGCVRLISVTTLHWNWGKGDSPGRISLFHQNGTQFGPYDPIGMNGTDGTPDALWVARPLEIIGPGTYLVSDSAPETWSQNDGSDNRGIVTIVYEPGACEGPAGEEKAPERGGTVPEGFEDAVIISRDESDPQTGDGAVPEETVPVIEQVVFTPVSREVSGGEPLYATLRVKNTGDRDLVSGYLTLRFISHDGRYASRGGRGALPLITAGEERDIPLAIRLEAPRGDGTDEDPLFCTVYGIDGTVSELMEGGYHETRGRVSLTRNDLITITGCCREPFTGVSLRGC